MTTATAVNPAIPKVHQTQLLIGNQWCDAQDGATFATINPASEAVIAQVARGGAIDIDLAVRAARKAFEQGPWPAMPARDRGRLLYRLADLIEDNAEELARLETLDNGKPIADSRSFDVPGAIAVIRYYAGWADKIHGQVTPTSPEFHTYTQPEPVGVCGQIIPWNFPLCMLAWKWGPALATGCTLILKPAEQTPLTALRVGELAVQAGFPPGVINIVPGLGEEAGDALVKHPLVDKIAFTGEQSTAKIILHNAADTFKRITCELGGKSPNVVFADADFDEAIEGVFDGIFLNQGQNCCAGSRAFVHERLYDRFLERLAEKADARKLGDPFDPNTEQGPQVDQAQYDKVMKYIDLGRQQGATCVAGGQRDLDRGYFVRPTVFGEVRDDMAIATDEIFGPVLSVLRFSDLAEVIRRANHTSFGLAAAVWTRDLEKAHQFARQVKAGTVWINAYNVINPAAPFGGFKQSGTGRELGEAALRNYIETKTVHIHTGDGSH